MYREQNLFSVLLLTAFHIIFHRRNQLFRVGGRLHNLKGNNWVELMSFQNQNYLRIIPCVAPVVVGEGRYYCIFYKAE